MQRYVNNKKTDKNCTIPSKKLSLKQKKSKRKLTKSIQENYNYFKT